MKRSAPATAASLAFGALLATLMAVGPTPAAAGNLWPGEEAREAAGFPFISKLHMVDPAAPLVVFTPGRNATARIAYGGHEGGLEQDFLAHWLNEAGYNFLGVSYPVVTASGAFDEPHPDFTIRAWGRGTAEVTQAVMEENGLTGPVIHADWSMSGKNAQPFAEAAQDMGIDQDFFVSMAATPPVPGTFGLESEVKLNELGLAAMPPGAKPASAQLGLADRMNGHVIIPPEAIATEYLGHSPVNLMARGLRYDAASKTAKRDHWADMQDTKFYDFDSFPLVAMVIPGNKGDSRHAVTDTGTWSFYIANAIFGLAGKQDRLKELGDGEFSELAHLVREAPLRLSMEVDGNHFFFVGEQGAHATADAIVELDARIEAVRSEIAELTATQ